MAHNQKEIVREFLNYHFDQIKNLTPGVPEDDLQRVSLVCNVFNFMADLANREILKESIGLRGIILMKLEEARAKPLYDPIKDSIDKLYDIIMAIDQRQ
jgi:hypothetical protein